MSAYALHRIVLEKLCHGGHAHGPCPEIRQGVPHDLVRRFLLQVAVHLICVLTPIIRVLKEESQDSRRDPNALWVSIRSGHICESADNVRPLTNHVDSAAAIVTLAPRRTDGGNNRRGVPGRALQVLIEVLLSPTEPVRRHSGALRWSDLWSSKSGLLRRSR